MHHSTHGNSDGHHWYADFIILCFLMTHFKDLSQAHNIVYLKKRNSKISRFTPSLLSQNIELLSTICRLQENKMLQKTATTGRQPVHVLLTKCKEAERRVEFKGNRKRCGEESEKM